jgi:hypothetical protein
VTDAANITELGDFGHLEVLKHPDGLAQLGQVLGKLLGLPGSSSSSDNSTANSSGNSTAVSVEVEDSQAAGNSTGDRDSSAAGSTPEADAAVDDVIEIADRSVELIEVTTSDDVIAVTAGPSLPKPFGSNAPWQGLASLQQQRPGYVGIAAVPAEGPQQQLQQQQQQQGTIPPGNSTDTLQ